MACNCVNDLEKQYEAHIKTQLKIEEVDSDFKAEFVGRVFTFSRSGRSIDSSPLALKFATEYRRKKGDGTPYKNLTKEENLVTIKFCPFCGVEHKGVEE